MQTGIKNTILNGKNVASGVICGKMSEKVLKK